MLKFNNISIEFNYSKDTPENKRTHPITIDDEAEDDSMIELTLDQAKWLRDNIHYVIKEYES